jgi:hypothetical protein
LEALGAHAPVQAQEYLNPVHCGLRLDQEVGVGHVQVRVQRRKVMVHATGNGLIGWKSVTCWWS